MYNNNVIYYSALLDVPGCTVHPALVSAFMRVSPSFFDSISVRVKMIYSTFVYDFNHFDTTFSICLTLIIFARFLPLSGPGLDVCCTSNKTLKVLLKFVAVINCDQVCLEIVCRRHCQSVNTIRCIVQGGSTILN